MSSPPRIADLVPRVQLRGAEIFAQHLEAELRDRYRCRLFALYAHPMQPAPVEGGTLDISPGVESGRIAAAWSLRRRVRAFRPDIIVAHGGEPLRLAVLGRLHRIAPIVYLRVAAVTPDLRTGGRVASLKAAYRRVEAFVPVSGSLKTELVQEFGVPAERCTVIRNARQAPPTLTEEQRIELRGELGLDPTEVMVAWVGRFVPEKDPVAAVELSRRLEQLAPGARVVMVGGGPLETEVRAAAQLAPRLVLTGERSDAPRVISAADILVSTSRTEGAPGVFVEALLAGVPAVAHDMGGTRDLLDETTGALVPPGHREALARAVAGLANDPVARANAASAARERGGTFDIAPVADEFDALYRAVLARRHN